tara:strand:+ start:291 stop:515 length:225 start_codon:yes stop_codon:yes gene_type:complete
MLLGNLVKFKVPSVAKYCNQYGTGDFIIEEPLFGVIIGWEKNPYFDNELLEIFAAGEVLFSIDPDDVMIVKETK